MILKSRTILILLCIITVWAQGGLFAEEAILDGAPKIIVLDPGHGGTDAGARGPTGSQEKEVTLTLARLLENELTPRFDVRLTRTDDYHINAVDRAAMANNLRTDLFISLHTSASFSPGTKGVWLYYCSERHGSGFNADAGTTVAAAAPTALKKWDEIYRDHQPASQRLAKILNSQLTGTPIFGHGDIAGLPLVVLMGTNAPAVMVETGHLSNPVEEKCLQDGKCLAQIAHAIAQGVDIFFDKTAKPPLETMDLQE